MTPPSPPQDLPRVKGRLPFDPQAFSGSRRALGAWLYGVLAAGFAGVAVYMALAVGHPLASGYVAGPAVGALWFGLRLFMTMGSRR
ncbi:MAG: hypothetical protein R3C25_01990 [Hyphomonadaceae bacterium]